MARTPLERGVTVTHPDGIEVSTEDPSRGDPEAVDRSFGKAFTAAEARLLTRAVLGALTPS